MEKIWEEEKIVPERNRRRTTKPFLSSQAGLWILGVLWGVGICLFPPNGVAPAASSSPLRILYNPILGKEATLFRYQPLTDHLAKVVGQPVQAISFNNYAEIRIPLARQEFEIAYLTPANYVKAEEFARLEVMLMELDAAGHRGYYSVIICRQDRPFQSVRDAKNSILAFVSLDSTSGFLVPLMYFLKELKEPPGTFARQVVFAGDHRAVVHGIYAKKYDIGATNDMDMARTLQADKLPVSAFRVLWKSELIPGAPICVRPNLSPAQKDAIRKAFLAFNQNPEGLRALQIGGFAPATAKDYNVIRQLSAVKP